MAQEAPTAPPVSPNPAPSPAVNKPGDYADAFADIEELERSTVAPKETPKAPADKPKSAAATAKPASKSTTEPKEPVTEAVPAKAKDDAGAVKSDDPAKGDGEPAAGEPDPSAQFKTAHDLRKDWRRKKERLEAVERENAELRAKSSKPTPDSTVLEENKTLKKRLEEYEIELRYQDYTKSEEFKEKYEKPYQQRFDRAVDEVKELYVNLEDGSSRPATEKDFERILGADKTEVKALARKMFGDEDYRDVLEHRRDLIEMNRKATQDAKNYRENANKRELERASKKLEADTQLKRLWEKANEEIPEKFPQYFKPIEGDDEYNAALKQGYEIIDAAHDPNLPIEEKVARLAGARHRAAGYRAQVLLRKRAEARVKELEEVVKGYEESAPKGGAGRGEGSRVTGGESNGEIPDIAAEIDAIEARSTTRAA